MKRRVLLLSVLVCSSVWAQPSAPLPGQSAIGLGNQTLYPGSQTQAIASQSGTTVYSSPAGINTAQQVQGGRTQYSNGVQSIPSAQGMTLYSGTGGLTSMRAAQGVTVYNNGTRCIEVWGGRSVCR